MRAIAPAGLLMALMLSGCANLRVTKVTAESECRGEEQQVKGFRYYLSRPYVVVKQPLKVSEERSLLVVQSEKNQLPSKLTEKWLAQGNPQRVDPKTAALLPLQPSEWDEIRAALAREATSLPRPVTPTQGPDARAALANRPVSTDPQVVPASGASTLASTATQNRGAAANFLNDTTVPSTDEAAKTVTLSGAIDVVFLPDFDEQYAVHNTNILAKSSYGLNFKDGWQLTGVGGEFDSTTIAIELLKTIDTAVNAAKTLGIAQLDARQRLLKQLASGANTKAQLNLKSGKGEQVDVYVFEVVRIRIIPPGVYRINKPWECSAAEQPVGCGLLEKLGLHATEIVTVIPAQPQAIDQPTRDGVKYPNEEKSNEGK